MWYVEKRDGMYIVTYEVGDRVATSAISNKVWKASTNQLALLKFTVIALKREMA